MFHFPELAPVTLWIRVYGNRTLLRLGFPIQKSPGQRIFSSSPTLIAAYHVFHRLPAPRHPPVALNNLSQKNLSFSFSVQLSKNRNLRYCRNNLRNKITNSFVPFTKDYLVEAKGIEPPTLCVQSRCSPSWATPPILWWAWKDLNFRPHAYQACALTTWATGPFLLALFDLCCVNFIFFSVM